MDEYTLRMTCKDPDVQVKWKVRASSRGEAVEASRAFFAAAPGGEDASRAPERGGTAGEPYGLSVLFLEPDEIDRRSVVDGPYDEADRCPECGYAPVEVLGEPCAVAERSMPVLDPHGDGSSSVPVGVHRTGWRCSRCGEGDAGPCVHD